MKLIINKFKRIENRTIEVPAEIRGGNGTCKSTILEAFAFCLTGKNMNGNEFKSVYDNRVDLHEAIADVIFIDNYGNEYQRVVVPVYQTSRQGIESIKTLRSTTCSKNKISVNDFSEDFADFQKFGTDFFFTQKEDVQRSIFIDIFKSQLPNFDVKAESLKLKELKKTQKDNGTTLKAKLDELKNIKDVDVLEIAENLQNAKNEYDALVSVDNSQIVSEINKENNELSRLYFEKKTGCSNGILKLENDIEKTVKEIESNNELLKTEKLKEFEPKAVIESSKIEAELKRLTEEFNSLEHFESVEDYARKYAASNPTVVNNATKVKEVSAKQFTFNPAQPTPCPLSGEACKTAELHAESSAKLQFDNSIANEVQRLKNENRQLLTNEMNDKNARFSRVKSDLEETTKTLLNIETENAKRKAKNDKAGSEFAGLKTNRIIEIENKITELTKAKKGFEEKLKGLQSALANMPELELKKLPESAVISDELKALVEEYSQAKELRIGHLAINENNSVKRLKLDAEIGEIRKNLFDIDQKIVSLSAQISEYFSNLKGVVSEAFKGDLLIDVELLEYVMSSEDYKDCFKITVDGKIFPYECNGALQNNAKFQILSTLQKIRGYNGVTLMDNCEANTTQPINICGTNAVITFATNDLELTIK